MNTIRPTARSDRGTVRLSIIFVGLLVVAVGALAYFIGWKGAEDARASKAWPTVPGTVIASDVRVSADPEGGDDYAPKVQYVYEVLGQNYQSSRISFGRHNSGDKRGVERKVASLPVGASVTVAYDPTDHGRAVLEPGEEGLNFIVKMIGAATIAAGVATLIGHVVLARRKQPSRLTNNAIDR